MQQGTVRGRVQLGLLTLVAAVGIGLTSGCAGTPPDLSSDLAEFDRYAGEVRRFEPKRETQEILQAGQDRRQAAEAELAGGDAQIAQMNMNKALADAHVALAAAQLESSQRRADHCLREVEQTRRGWKEAIFVLEQTETVVARVAPLSRRLPEVPEPPALPQTTLATDVGSMTVQSLRSAWDAWSGAAEGTAVSLVDLEPKFDRRMDAAALPKADPVEVAYHLHMAARVLQEAECRVRNDAANQVCVRATTLANQLSESRDAALKATLELERGLQDDLRSELDKTRQEARSRQDELYDALGQLEGQYAQISQDARGTILSLADILFDFGKATLRRDVEFALVKVSTILNQFPEMSIEIEGHTDSIGSEDFNQKLSERRAEVVMKFLAEQGVSQARMTSAGFGFTRPVADNDSEAGRQKNRRVDLVIQ